MQVRRTLAINHQSSSARGKYGLTITSPRQGTANVRDIASDEELASILLSIGRTQPETTEVLNGLRQVNSKVKYDCEVDEDALIASGF